MRSVKIGVLSLNNGHARMYFSFLMRSPMFELVGVSADPTQRSRVFLNQLPGVPVYDSDEELLDAHPRLKLWLLQGLTVRILNVLSYALSEAFIFTV